MIATAITTRNRIAATIAIIAVLGSLTSALRAATVTFGAGEGWNYHSPLQTLDSTDDAMSVRFTAFEDITVDRLYQRFVGIDPNTTVRIGIMADNGSGSPTGTFLSATTPVDPVDGNPFLWATFDPVALTSGNVYHAVTQVETIGGGESFNIYGYGNNLPIRPYDRAEDLQLNTVRQVNGAAWASVNTDPHFVLGNGSDTAISGPSQPYQNQGLNLYTYGGAGSADGQQFTILPVETGSLRKIADVAQLTVRANAYGGITDPLIFRLREADGTVLATATMTYDQAGVAQTLDLDTTIELFIDTTYLLTTETTAAIPGEFYRIMNQMAAAGTGAATWGGTDRCFPIRSGASNDWSSYSPVLTDWDMYFSFTGTPVPEPSVAVMLGLGMLVTCCRRR